MKIGYLKYLSLLFVLAVGSLITTGCGKVEPGYVGIVVNNYGSQRGVSDFPIRTGRVWYNPFTEDLHVFPTFMQNYIWTASKDEGREGVDESFTVNSIEGASVNFDVAFSAQFVADSVPHVFVKFRKDPDYIIGVYVRSNIRNAFSEYASRMKVTDIFGAQKTALQDSVTKMVQKILTPDGIIVDQLSIIGKIRVDQEVEASINAVLTASQRAIEAQNKVLQARAEAEQLVQTARGDSAAANIRAVGQAEANRKLNATLTPALIQSQWIAKWNGQMPTVTSANTPLLMGLPTSK